MLDENADVILPVGGPIGQGTFAAIRERNAAATGIGVDVDWTETVPEYADLMLTHILKRIDNSVYGAIERAIEATGVPASEFTVCEVSDTGGIDDKSFNQNAWDGALRAQAELGVTARFLESTTQEDYARNINQFLQEECDLIVTVGFLLGDDTKAAALANPDQRFAIVDYAYDQSPLFVNILANGGVDLGPFHDYDSEISAETKAEIEALRQALLDGTVTPSDYFEAP
jgi:basic membrane lipoprotein Med (substrate-binding protein (PBP1-ABC) superfamily)